MVRRIDACISALVLAALSTYWLLWAWAGPVNNPNAQVYNLARLLVIERDGLFFNESYTTLLQLIMPWSFDAVHYSLLHLRHGYALPSFLCMLGAMAIGFTWAAERGDVTDGLRMCLGFLAMPMVILQATTTKNDLVLAFCLFCWVQALRRYTARPTHWSIAVGALALSFMIGAKLTGAMYGAIAVAISLWLARRRRRDMALFAAWLGLFVALNGSVEIYLNNWLQFGSWRGDPALYAYNTNHDGWKGIVANELRYATSLLDPQLLPTGAARRLARWKFDLCQQALVALGAQGLGFMSIPWRALNERNLLAIMLSPVAMDNRATFGIIGTLAITVMPLVLLARRRLDFPALLFLGGVTAHLIVAVTLGWHPGTLRYFTAAACLAWAGMSLLLVSRSRPWLSLGATVALAACAVLVPFRADRNPSNLVAAFKDPDALLTPFNQEMLALARTWKRDGEVPVILTADRGPVFHLYDELGSDLISIPNVSEEALIAVDEVHRRGTYRVIAMKSVPRIASLACERLHSVRHTRICLWRRNHDGGASPGS